MTIIVSKNLLIRSNKVRNNSEYCFEVEFFVFFVRLSLLQFTGITLLFEWDICERYQWIDLHVENCICLQICNRSFDDNFYKPYFSIQVGWSGAIQFHERKSKPTRIYKNRSLSKSDKVISFSYYTNDWNLSMSKYTILTSYIYNTLETETEK